jgi:hypothetical protein
MRVVRRAGEGDFVVWADWGPAGEL